MRIGIHFDCVIAIDNNTLIPFKISYEKYKIRHYLPLESKDSIEREYIENKAMVDFEIFHSSGYENSLEILTKLSLNHSIEIIDEHNFPSLGKKIRDLRENMKISGNYAITEDPFPTGRYHLLVNKSENGFKMRSLGTFTYKKARIETKDWREDIIMQMNNNHPVLSNLNYRDPVQHRTFHYSLR